MFYKNKDTNKSTARGEVPQAVQDILDLTEIDGEEEGERRAKARRKELLRGEAQVAIKRTTPSLGRASRESSEGPPPYSEVVEASKNRPPPKRRSIIN